MNINGKKILFQGDSITDMARGRSDWDKNHLYGHSFVFLLASDILCEYPNKNIEIINRGNSGDRSVDLLSRWQSDAIELNPDIINILVGINDIILDVDSDNGVDPQKYIETLEQIIKLTKEKLPATKLIICEPFCHISLANEKYQEEMAKRIPIMQKSLKELSLKYNATFVPLQEEFDSAYKKYPLLSDDYWIWDGIHPTAQGQRLIAKKWLKCIDNSISL